MVYIEAKGGMGQEVAFRGCLFSVHAGSGMREEECLRIGLLWTSEAAYMLRCWLQ